jgi:hypothetical protein
MTFETTTHDAAAPMSKEGTLVVFRRWRDTGSIIALFPELPSDSQGRFCDAYEHVGQHGGADFLGVVQVTRPVRIDEAEDLIAELTQIGYRLKPAKRASQRVHESRRATARAIKDAAPSFRDG